MGNILQFPPVHLILLLVFKNAIFDIVDLELIAGFLQKL